MHSMKTERGKTEH